jgi:pimeloyl-ACP methyl ester carboxylesterase
MRHAWPVAGVVAILIALALVGFMLIGRHGAAPRPGTPAPLAAAEGIQYLPCWFAPPAGHRAKCGSLTVPEKRGAAGSAMLHLRFVVFQSAAPRPADPIVYISGGPGEPAHIEAHAIDYWWRWVDREAWLKDRDLVVIDPRGVGLSEPRMECPEFVAAAARVYGGADGGDAIWAAAAAQCALRLVAAGIDLASFNTAAIAADLESLLPKLGYPHWTLLATSYGTRVALRVAAAMPARTRAMILDSVDPPEIREYVEGAAGAAAAFAQIFKDCADEHACNLAFPDLAATFEALVRRAAQTPLTFTLDDGNGREMTARLDDAKLIEMFSRSFYDARQIQELPALITAVGAGNMAPLRPLVRLAMADYAPGGASLGVYFSVECHDDFPFNPRAEVESAAAAAPLFKNYALSTLPLAACPSWPAGAAAPDQHAGVTTDVPTLMLSGALDPATPAPWAKAAAQRLPHAYQVIFPGVGHGVLEARDCAGRLVGRFLADSSKAPYDACMLLLAPPQFGITVSGDTN